MRNEHSVISVDGEIQYAGGVDKARRLRVGNGLGRW